MMSTYEFEDALSTRKQPASEGAVNAAPEQKLDDAMTGVDIVEVASVRFHAATETQCVANVMQQLERGRGGWIVTANLDHLRRLRPGNPYVRVISEADFIVADGMPILWAAAIQGTPLPERVAGSDLVSSLAQGACRHGRSLFLLGGDPGVAEAACRVLVKRNPGLRIVGWHYPAPGFQHRPEEIELIRRKLSSARPDIVYVALGSPKQERFIASNRALLPAAWWIGVGISFSYLAGALRQPPPWLRRIGGEWILRLIQEPRRMAVRYLVRGMPFAVWLFGRSVWLRLTGGAGRLR